MPDMLVKLYDLPSLAPECKRMGKQGILIRRPLPAESGKVLGFVQERFGDGWTNECTVCFARQPVRCFIAQREKRILGFACYDATAPNYFGPTGVLEEMRGNGIGRALLLHSLYALREEGYGYAIIGWAGPVSFYEKCCGATVIPDSEPGLYRDML